MPACGGERATIVVGAGPCARPFDGQPRGVAPTTYRQAPHSALLFPSPPAFLLEWRPMDILAEISRVMELESRALGRLRQTVGPAYEKAVLMIYACPGKVILTGMSKHGITPQKTTGRTHAGPGDLARTGIDHQEDRKS